MTSASVVVIGDALLDRDVYGRTERLCPDAPVPVVDVEAERDSAGGAGLTALLCAAAGVHVTLVAPIADDAGGERLRSLLSPDVDLRPLGHAGGTRCKTRIRTAGQSLLRLDDGGTGAPVQPDLESIAAALAQADVVLVSDYGGGTTAHPGVRRVLAESARSRPLVWDPHPRGGVPVLGASLVTPNLAEARTAASRHGLRALSHPDQLAPALRAQWKSSAVCVTAGSDGAYLALSASETMFVPAKQIDRGDPCGAGDRFAASAAVALANGAILSEAVVTAVEDATAWVAAGGAEGFRLRTHQAARRPSERRAADVVASVRAAGGSVVATGGCFDILHAGHVASLEAARRLGDALVVLLNSDESVRRLKGPGRPAVGEEDRARVLAALSCVDGVEIFAEDDPRLALDRLRPDVWVKGGDYDTALMPEAQLVRSWGGRVVLLPYVEGHSTTSILQRRAGQAAQPGTP
jgi:rfaE bifunctional protein nucleotidyltransferase chain/domain/rfaE bifunctional protein kinase chain/domain